MYRLYIDIPLGTDEKQAIDTANLVVQWFFHDNQHQCMKLKQHKIDNASYRLGNDEDRQKSNYLLKTPDGHVTKKRNIIKIKA